MGGRKERDPDGYDDRLILVVRGGQARRYKPDSTLRLSGLGGVVLCQSDCTARRSVYSTNTPLSDKWH